MTHNRCLFADKLADIEITVHFQVNASQWDQFVIILVMNVGTIMNLSIVMFKTGLER